MAANRHFGMGEEATWGATGPSATPTIFLELLSESLKVEKEFESIGTLRGYSISQVSELTSIVRGDTEFLANLEGMVALYYALLGSDSFTSGTPAGANTHVFPDAAAGIPAVDRIGLSWALEVARGAAPLCWRYLGCKPTALSLSAAVDAAARISATWLGKSEEKGLTPTSATFPTLSPFKPKDITVTIGGGSVCARSVELNIENPLDETFCLGGTGLTNEPDRSDYLKVTGSVECLFDDYGEYDHFNNDSGLSPDTDVLIEIEETSIKKTTFDMDKVRMTQATPSISGRDRLSATYEFESFYNSATTENLVITVISQDADLTPP